MEVNSALILKEGEMTFVFSFLSTVIPLSMLVSNPNPNFIHEKSKDLNINRGRIQDLGYQLSKIEAYP